MDEDVTPPAFNCFIREGSDTPARRLTGATAESYSTFMKHAESIQKCYICETHEGGSK